MATATKAKKVVKKPVALKPVHILLDETGSMASMRAEAISGYNKYLDGLAGQKLQIALTKFDSTKLERVHGFVEPKKATRLSEENYRPGAMTNLFDAMAQVIRQTEAEVKDDALIVVLTDGLENASRECTMEQLNALIKAQEAKGWNFLYLGVAADAWLNERAFAGAAMADNAMQSTGGRGLGAAMNAASSYTMAYAAAAPSAAVSLDEDEKQKVRDASN